MFSNNLMLIYLRMLKLQLLKLKVTEHNFGENFKDQPINKMFCVLFPNLVAHLTITFKTSKMPYICWDGGSRLLGSHF